MMQIPLLCYISNGLVILAIDNSENNVFYSFNSSNNDLIIHLVHIGLLLRKHNKRVTIFNEIIGD